MHSETPTPVEHEQVRNYATRVIVAGTRGYTDYAMFSSVLDDFVADREEEIVFLTGMATSGADAMIVQWCKERGRPWSEFPAQWDDLDAPGAVIRHTRSGKPYNAVAGHDRNKLMGDHGTHLIVFWDSVSPGTRHMREYAISRSLKILTVFIDKN